MSKIQNIFIAKVCLLLIILLTLSSCGTKIKNFDKYEKHLLPATQFLPSKEDLEQKIPKVLVIELNENNIETAKQAKLGNSLAKNIENILAQNELASIIDRDSATDLKDEIILSQINNDNSNYSGPIIADYAITGTISNANFTSEYKSAQNYFNRSTGTYEYKPPKFIYQSLVSGNIKILKIPSLDTVKVIEFDGKETRQENAQNNGGIRLGGLSIGGTENQAQKEDNGLIREAAKKAIFNMAEDLQNIFAKNGYILEKRVLKNKTIFKVNLGKNDSIKEGDHFNIIAKYQTQNPITKEDEIETRIIASGKISNQINPDSAWIIIKNKEDLNKIRLGDRMQVFYKKSFKKKHGAKIKKSFDLFLGASELYLKNQKKQ